EILRDLLEDRLALVAVGLQQRVAAPAVQLRGQLPAEIDRILQSVVEAEAAIGRMAVRGVAGDEGAADLVFLRDRDPQIPEADVVELDREGKTRSLVQHAGEVEILARGVLRHRRVEEEALAHVDAAEELPIA